MKGFLVILYSGNETIEEMAERMHVTPETLNPKQAKAIVIHGHDLKQLDDEQLDDILRWVNSSRRKMGEVRGGGLVDPSPIQIKKQLFSFSLDIYPSITLADCVPGARMVI